MRSRGVYIVNHDTRDLLRRCLRSVLAEGPDEIVVADSASTDGSAEMVAAEFPSVTLLRLDDNLGYGGAANRAVGIGRADDILLLNADTVVEPGALDALFAHLDGDERPAILGPRISDPDGSPQTSCFHFPTPLHVSLYLSGIYRWIPRAPMVRRRTLQGVAGDSPVEVPWVLGAALAFRRDAFLWLGGFDETFFMYFEEVDLCYRLRGAGGHVLFVPSARIVHRGGASTERRPVEMGIRFFTSLARFYRKHYSRAALARLTLVVRFFATLRWARSLILLRLVLDETRRNELGNDLAIHRSLALGGWARSSSPREEVAMADVRGEGAGSVVEPLTGPPIARGRGTLRSPRPWRGDPAGVRGTPGASRRRPRHRR